MLMRHINHRHRDVVTLCELTDVAKVSSGPFVLSARWAQGLPRVGDASTEVESAFGIEFVVCDSLGISDQGGRLVLLLDELYQFIRSNTRLVAQRETLGQELNETKLQRVPDQPKGELLHPTKRATTHLNAMARSTLLPRSMTFFPIAGTSACAACFLAK